MRYQSEPVAEPYALGMCAQSTMLDDPAPRYASARDCVVGFVEPSFGKHNWKLPLRAIPHPSEVRAREGTCWKKSGFFFFLNFEFERET